MNPVKKLSELQDTDLELKEARIRLDKINALLSGDEIMSRLKTAISEIDGQLAEIKKQRKDVEWEADDLRKNVAQINSKLYSGKITNSKELMDLEKDLKVLKARLKEKEDALLELMDSEEVVNQKAVQITEQVKDREITREKETSELTSQKVQIEQRIEELKELRREQVSEIDSEAMKAYEKITSKRGSAIVRVEQGRCKGCRISLSMNELQRARAGALVHCSSCGMILFME